VPLTKAELKLEGIPAGATVLKAYLYWVVYGESPRPGIGFDGAAIQGRRIGTSEGTCWNPLPDPYQNYVYREDVSAKVQKNGVHRLTNFASVAGTYTEFAHDTQGAALVVLYKDPADPLLGTVVLNDGAVVANGNWSAVGSFSGFAYPKDLSTVDSAWVHFGAGDGQQPIPDGRMSIGGQSVPPNDGMQHWKNGAGAYWDVTRHNALDYIAPGAQELKWVNDGSADCVVFAFAALEYHSELTDTEPLPGAAGAGSGGTSGTSSAGTPAGGTSSAGTPSAEGGAPGDAGAPSAPTSQDSSGCDCSIGQKSSTTAGGFLLFCAALFTSLARRRHSSTSKSARVRLT